MGFLKNKGSRSVVVATLALLSLPGDGGSQERIDLRSAAPDFEVIGRSAVNKTGQALTTGDFNGDGWQDLAVGAPGRDENARPKEGRVFVFWGSVQLGGQRDLDLTTADLEIIGSQLHAGLGTALSAADVNGDGIDDLIMSEPGAATDAGEQTGVVSILFGRQNLPGTMTVLDADVRISGEDRGNQIGEALATGDVNGDGTTDVIVGARMAGTDERAVAGKVYVLHGQEVWPRNIDLANTSTDVTIVGKGNNQFVGNAVAAADVNDDGYDDLIVGNFKADVLEGVYGGKVDAGKTYVFFGSDTLAGEIDLANEEPDVTLLGAAEQDHLGIAMTGGDLNGDGISDLVVGARWAEDDAPKNAGKVYVFYGRQRWPTTVNLASEASDLEIVGAAGTSDLGMALAMGDVNGDQREDLIIGAAFSSPEGRSLSGTAFLYLGRPGAAGKISSELLDVIVLGAGEDHALGSAVATGDLNGDGLQEYIFSAVDAEPGGRVYVFFGDVTTEVEAPETDRVPERFALHQNYPNPFNAGTTIRYDVPRKARIVLKVYNLMGQEMATLVNGPHEPGTYTLRWQAGDLPTGAYFYRLQSDGARGYVATRTLIVLK